MLLLLSIWKGHMGEIHTAKATGCTDRSIYWLIDIPLTARGVVWRGFAQLLLFPCSVPHENLDS